MTNKKIRVQPIEAKYFLKTYGSSTPKRNSFVTSRQAYPTQRRASRSSSSFPIGARNDGVGEEWAKESNMKVRYQALSATPHCCDAVKSRGRKRDCRAESQLRQYPAKRKSEGGRVLKAEFQSGESESLSLRPFPNHDDESDEIATETERDD